MGDENPSSEHIHSNQHIQTNKLTNNNEPIQNGNHNHHDELNEPNSQSTQQTNNINKDSSLNQTTENKDQQDESRPQPQLHQDGTSSTQSLTDQTATAEETNTSPSESESDIINENNDQQDQSRLQLQLDQGETQLLTNQPVTTQETNTSPSESESDSDIITDQNNDDSSLVQTTENNDQQDESRPQPQLHQDEIPSTQLLTDQTPTTEETNTSPSESESDSDIIITQNNDNSLLIETTQNNDQQDELKSQRQVDDDEIPPSDLLMDQRATTEETSPSESDTIPSNDRPLTELETPYENHDNAQDKSFKSSEDEILLNNETTLSPNETSTNNDISYVNEIKPMTFSSFLPDVGSETSEQNQDNSIQPEKVLITETNPSNFTEEDFPRLPRPSNPMGMVINDVDYPPLPTRITPVESNEFIRSEPEDVLGNRTLFKQTIVKGAVSSRPTRSTMVEISYSLSLVDSLTSNVRLIENVSNEKYFVSEKDLIPAIDICVQLMDCGERATIDSDVRHCYGQNGCEDKQIPPVTSINPYRMKIELELHSWISPPDVQHLSIDQRLYWGDKKRQMGNFYFRRQEYEIALECYRGALRFVDTTNNPLLISFDQSQKSILNDRFIQVQNNVAQVNLLLNKYEACLNAVEHVLKADPRNVKALFRQGKALFELGKYEQAIRPLKLFQQIQRDNFSTGIDNDKANEMINICENKLANYKKDEKEIYRRMFQPTTTTTTTTTTTKNQQRQNKNPKQIDNPNNSWWPYVALGTTAALAAIGVATFIKYRKV